ncbi:GNAT family N-acetyltransferase [Actinomadura sp. DC4]|uniref:GNAT family N-acetyltransferase n=1 Tax=Actinomadura sp. DC4 TaxID=3055069 RepID=UPI0025B1DC05|nr:GNAT family N-acetyltransferase [Actinomadura sp. DC4]MDN3354662.1 GNAT family N-acetyltransferase [Actinomadura sp. DC4]
MGWDVTGDPDAYVAEAGAFLRADPVENTVPLGLIETLRVQGADVFGSDPLFGWWRSPDGVRGAFVQTGTFPLLLSALPEHAATELAALLADRGVTLPGVNGNAEVTQAFATGWTERTGVAAEVRMRQRLFRLDRLAMPDPLPEGGWRTATEADHDLVHAWFKAFEVESQGGGSVSSRLVSDRIGHAGVLLWEAAGVPVALAARTRIAAGMARIGPVYTPVGYRRRGYGAAVTAVLTRAVLDAGADHVVLFTDLANPTSNAIYQRLGYRAVSDRLVLGFVA